MSGGPEPPAFSAPAILRFATDSFMEDYLNMLATDPRRLGEFRAVPETWRGKLTRPEVPAAERPFALALQRLGFQRHRAARAGQKLPFSKDARDLPLLKLYQPGHQRHYLISTCLVCRSAGLPDRKVDLGKQEKVSFLLRRLLPPRNAKVETFDEKTWEEFAWVATRTGYEWIRVRGDGRASDRVVLEGEERLPLFPANCVEDDQRTRRLFAGVIPVARRDTYLGAQRRDEPPQQDKPTDTTDFTARKILFRKEVLEPWRNILESGIESARAIEIPDATNGFGLDDSKKRVARKSAREQIQVGSWLTLLDLARYLAEQIPDLWSAVQGGSVATEVKTAFDALKGVTLSGDAFKDALLHEYHPTSGDKTEILPTPTIPPDLVAALRLYGGTPTDPGINPRKALEEVETPYDRAPNDEGKASRAKWPSFIFPLIDPEFPDLSPLAPAAITRPMTPAQFAALLNSMRGNLDNLGEAILGALPRVPAGPEPEIPSAARLPANQAEGVFRIRCVYERPVCGPLHEDVVSEPTEPFELAAYFDPDAPARPIRIGLPLDTTPAGLRKFDKNTAFVMSDILCGQVQKLKGLGFGDLVRSVLPWPLHKDISVGDMNPCGSGTPGGGFGTICSLSIPIITLCALILLMIMVSLMNIIFRWVPFFIMCFPIPGLKGKR